jgi:hypothetical protein
MKWLVLVIALSGCGTKKEAKAEEAPPEEAKKVEEKADTEEEGGLRGRIGGLVGEAKDKAKKVGGDLADEATNKAKDLGSDAEQLAVSKAKALAEKAGELSGEALAAGTVLKGDLLGKLDFLKSHFDLAIDSASESESDYKARISGMKQIKVGEYVVGFAQDSKHPLGTVYKWQFRITWRVPLTGKGIRLSFFTNEELKDLEDAATLLTIISAADRLAK